MDFVASKELSGLIVIPVFEKKEAEALKKAEELTGAKTEFKAKKNEFLLLRGKKSVLLYGLGEKIELKNIRLMAASVVSTCEELKEKNATLVSMPEDCLKAFVEACLIYEYSFDKYKKRDEEKIAIEKIFLPNIGKEVSEAIIVAKAQNYTRSLANEPSSIATPEYVQHQAALLAKENDLKIKVLESSELRKLGLNGIAEVGSGSDHPPRLVILEYNPSGKKTVCLVGKGITFDTGGLQIKPGRYMHGMKYDKTGACVVLGTIKAVSELKLDVHVVALMALAENGVSDRAYKPGDIIKIGEKTIEILHTDAEGRLVLADALTYSKNYKPDEVIDLATLTGAILVCLGSEAAGVFSNDSKLEKDLIQAGEETGERLWPFPMWDEYSEKMKGTISDLKNISGWSPDDPDSILAACFLKEFVPEKTKWAHLDIAGVDNTDGKGFYKEGNTGFGVRLLTEYLKKQV
ncbi:leucyl aminopeptidase [Candidatus Micrarchaeota archaeon]|nr:leucyl aminopeptidase [Candidatus Micrarchaeota archaeon]